jgi:exodeoxyribonuclease-3
VLVGDLNIAPLESDVWSHKQLLKVVSHTPVETEGLLGIIDAGGWVDAVRHLRGPDEKLYSWWSYRSRDWKVNDRGRRLDHVWVTPGLVPSLRQADILRDARDWVKPSDHVPVTVELDL